MKHFNSYGKFTDIYELLSNKHLKTWKPTDQVSLNDVLYVALKNTRFPPACPTWLAAVEVIQSISVARKMNYYFQVIPSQKAKAQVFVWS